MKCQNIDVEWLHDFRAFVKRGEVGQAVEQHCGVLASGLL